MYIYGLYSEDINVIRYVGKTNNVNKRLAEHVMDAKRNSKTHKHRWIQQQLSKQISVNITILEQCDDSVWKEREIYWISQFKNLTNHTKGGEGGHGNLYTVSYDDAKLIVKDLKFKNREAWFAYAKTHDLDIPNDPRTHFKNNGWVSWGDFLGNNNPCDKLKTLNYISYDEAKKYIKEHITAKSIESWKVLAKNNEIPDIIPNRPDRYYKKRGWVNWYDFLGKSK